MTKLEVDVCVGAAVRVPVVVVRRDESHQFGGFLTVTDPRDLVKSDSPPPGVNDSSTACVASAESAEKTDAVAVYAHESM